MFGPEKQVASANQDMKGGRNWAQFGLTGTEKADITRIALLVRNVESVHVVQNGTAPVRLHGVSLIQDSSQALLTHLKEGVTKC